MRHHRADAAAPENVAFRAGDGERRRLDPVRLSLQRIELSGANRQQTHREASRFAGEPSAGAEWRHATAVKPDAPAEEQIGRHAAAGGEPGARTPGEREDAEVLEEEITLLGKEQIEAREIDLLFVHFDLREVGIDRQVGRQVLRDAVLDVAADPARVVVRQLRRHGRVGGHAGQRVRLQLDGTSARRHL